MESQPMMTRLQARKPADEAQAATWPAALPSGPKPLVLPRLLPAVASGVLLWACHFPLALGWLAWVALVPVLCLVRSDGRPRNIYLAAWAGGLIFFWPVLQWMRVADYRMYYTWGMLATYCSLYFPLAIFLLRRLDRGTQLPLVVTVPTVWVSLEFIRSFLLTGFAWYYLGHTQHTFLPLIQITDLGGAYAVSLLVAAVNAWLFEALYQSNWLRQRLRLTPPGERRPRLVLHAVVLVVAVVAALGYGLWRLDQAEFQTGPRLALLQGNLDQRLRNLAAAPEGGEMAMRKMSSHFFGLCDNAMAQIPRPDLIVWPETSFPGVWFDSSRAALASLPPDWPMPAEIGMRDFIREVSAKYHTNHLLGVNSEVLDSHGKLHRHVSGLLLQATGALGGRYDKIHRVPFGEYVPLRDWLPFMDRFAPYEYDYSIRKGEHLTRFDLGDHKFGVLICFEDTDPFLARRYGIAGDDGPAVDFLINISNDGWFDGSSEHEEHLAICRFRAIETRRAVARAVNMGISAVIDSNGRVLEPELADKVATQSRFGQEEIHRWQVKEQGGWEGGLAVFRWASFKKTAGVLTATIPIDQRTSLYSLWGDWLPGICLAVVAIGLIWSVGHLRFSVRPRKAVSG
jgi:apolipoprotein N-acyltransferase